MTIHRVKWDGTSNMSNSDSKKTESRFPGCHVLPHRSLGMRLEASLLTIKYLPSLTNDIAWQRYYTHCWNYHRNSFNNTIQAYFVIKLLTGAW